MVLEEQRFSSGVLETMDFVMKKIDDAPTVPTFGHWISVNDRLPEDGHFLVCHKGGEVYMDYMTEFYRPKFKKVDATSYWMPLPESPKEDKQ